jgi:surfeit locus 1 family protein
MLISLLALGGWQVQRYSWKTDLINKLQARSESAAIALPVKPDALEDIEFQHVRVAGTLLHQHEFYLFGRSLRGSPGLHVVTPLKRADGEGYVLVDRGWVPFEKREPAARTAGQVEGVVEIEGIVRLARGPGTFTPDNDVKGNNWFFIEPGPMAVIAGLDALPDFYVLSGVKDTPGGFPVARQWRVDVRNNHIEYAITWFLMALALIVIYVVYHRQRR